MHNLTRSIYLICILYLFCWLHSNHSFFSQSAIEYLKPYYLICESFYASIYREEEEDEQLNKMMQNLGRYDYVALKPEIKNI